MSNITYLVSYTDPTYVTRSTTFTGRRVTPFEFVATDKDVAIRQAEKLMNSPVSWENYGMKLVGRSAKLNDDNRFHGSIVVRPLPEIVA